MGGGLAFLNKKGWHTGGYKNQEEVWKREQEAQREKAKVEELKKQILEERQMMELRAVAGTKASASGKQQHVERVDFLYAGPLAGRVGDELRREHLLGKPVDDIDKLNAANADAANAATTPKDDAGANGKTAGTTTTTTSVLRGGPAPLAIDSANERWARLHADPLLAMKQKELAALKRVRDNPVTMAKLRDEVSRSKDEKRARKEERRAEKRARKEERREAKRVKKAHKLENDSDKPVSLPPRAAEDEKEQQEQERRYDGATAQKGENVRYGLTPNANAPYRPARRWDDDRKPTPSVLPAAPSSASYRGAAAAGIRRHGTPRGAVTPQSHVRTNKPPARMTDDERQRRLREMRADADAHEGDRHARFEAAVLRDERNKDADGKQAVDRHHSERASFIADVEKNIYGHGSGATLEERVGRRRFFTERHPEHS